MHFACGRSRVRHARAVRWHWRERTDVSPTPVNIVLVPESTWERNARLRDELIARMRDYASPETNRLIDESLGIVTGPAAPSDLSAPVHAVVSYGEINDQHGTGPLTMRLFRGRRGIFSIRFRDDWKIHDFGDWHVKLPLQPYTADEIDAAIWRLLHGRNVQTVTCVPFTAVELLAAMAVRDRFGAKLCLWIMDDQNVTVNSIPDEIMRQCLEKCSLRLATHPELRSAYQEKFGLPMHLLPAVVPASLVCKSVPQSDWDGRAKTSALFGSFWDQSWFDRLCAALEKCDSTCDWYGQNHSPWLSFPPETLRRARITPFGILPEGRLPKELNRYPFVIVPAGMLDGTDRHIGTAYLSLPGRILFAAAVSRTPILIAGSEHSCGARFVKHFGIGMAAPYDAHAIAQAMEYLRQPDIQTRCRANAASVGRLFSDNGIVDWLSASIERGAPVDQRFEDAFSGYNSDWIRP